MELNTEDKQAFLRTEIVEQGYSPEDFVEYLVSLKPQCSDILGWTIQELRQTVELFKRSHIPKAQSEVKGFDVITDQHIVEIAQQDLNKVQYDKGNLYDLALEAKVETVPTIYFEKFPQQNPHFSVGDPELKYTGGSFFGIGKASDIWFTIKGSVSNIVQRSDKEFDWLRKNLTLLFPGNIIPPYTAIADELQKKNVAFQERQATFASAFLNRLSQNKTILNSKIFNAFVNWNDKRFNEFKTVISKQLPPLFLKNIPNSKGYVNLEITPKNRSINRAIKRYANDIRFVFDNLQGCLLNVNRDLDRLSSSILKMSDCFAELQQHYSNMVNYAPQIKNNMISEVFISLNNTFAKWGQAVKQQMVVLEKNLDPLFEYTRKEHDSMLELYRKRSYNEDEYLKYKLSIQKKKDKMYSDQHQWQVAASGGRTIEAMKNMPKDEVLAILMPQEIGRQTQLRQWVAFFNYSCQHQFCKLAQDICGTYLEAFGRISDELKVIEQFKIQNIKDFEVVKKLVKSKIALNEKVQ